MPTAARAMVTVANHPKIRKRPFTLKAPMTFSFVAMRIVITMMGTATTPLITALQKSALTGSSGVKFIIPPTSVAAAIVP